MTREEEMKLDADERSEFLVEFLAGLDEEVAATRLVTKPEAKPALKTQAVFGEYRKVVDGGGNWGVAMMPTSW